ncbi:MAG: FAD-dependent oxidoreductase [Myxococcales bacterium]
MERVGAIVIGAGAVGLAVARALAQAGHETIVCDAQTAIGQGVSSRNSEVIHAGLYYTPGSLKALLCVRGKELLYALCASHGVPHRNCGKFVVAGSEAEAGALKGLAARAAANGVPVEWLDEAQAKAIEPALQCVAALSSPTTGIVDSHSFMLALQGDLERAGGFVARGSAVDSAVLGRAGGPHVVRMRDGTTASPALSRKVCTHLESLGYKVSYNHPYKGVELVRRYGDPAHDRYSIQIEINRKLYMDETTLELTPAHEQLKAGLRSLALMLLATDPRRL